MLEQEMMKSLCLIALFVSQSYSQQSNQMTEVEKATLGAGCFWCVEAIFERLEGVTSVVAGYAGGSKPHPTYKDVCTGTTGHAEVAQIIFDPKKISYERLLEVFWKAHDPTTLNQQGADQGTQYRSVIFYHDYMQKIAAEKSRREAAINFADPIVTEITPLDVFYEADNYHQNYYQNNPNAPYCRFVIKPKLDKLDVHKQTR